MSVKELIELCKNGDPRAQRIFYDHYVNGVYAACRRYLGDHHEAEDAVSVVFSKSFVALGSFQFMHENGMKKWLRTISIRVCLNKLRNRVKFIERKDEVFQEEEAIDFSHHLREVLKEMETLPDGYRVILNMYALDGYTHAEIAEVLNISINTSKSQLRKARKLLKTRINPFVQENK